MCMQISRCVAFALGMTLDWSQPFHTVASYDDALVDVTTSQRVRLVLAPAA